MTENEEINRQETSDIIIFNEGREVLGLDLSIVKEVIEVDHVKPFPLASKKIEGVINLRDEIVPIVNTKTALNLSDNGLRTVGKSKILIIEHPLEKIGLLVDAVQEILPITDDLFVDVPDSVQTEIDLKYIEQVGVFRNRPLIFLDIDSFIENLFISLPEAFRAKSKTQRSVDRDQYVKLGEKAELRATPVQVPPAAIKSAKTVVTPAAPATPAKSTAKAATPRKPAKKGTPEKMEFSESDLDIFSELGNIGAGHASNALSQMINKKVMIDVPLVSLTTMDKLRGMFGKIGDMVTGTFSLVTKNVDANIVLMFSVQSIENILQIILDLPKPKKLKSANDVAENEQSAIQELNSILIGNYVAALSNFLRVSIDPPKHHFFFEKTETFLANLEKESEKDVVTVIIETKMNVVGTEPIIGYFLMIPSAQNLKDILKRIQEIWEK